MSSRPIFVIGPSRSGTSVATRVINLLGAPLCIDSDLYTAPDNPDGHWESKTVISLNDMLLQLIDASWGLPPSEPCPPDLVSDDVRRDMRRQFLDVHPSPGWVCKDPRLCFTLPCWITTLDVDPIVVLVRRRPSEVVASLTVDGIPKAHAIAMWERYARSAFRVALGRAVVTVDFDDLLAHPLDVAREIGGSLEEAGARPSAARAVAGASAVEARTRRHALDPVNEDFTGHQLALWEVFAELPSWTTSLNVSIPPESATSSELLDALKRERWLTDHVRRLEERPTVLQRGLRRIRRGR